MIGAAIAGDLSATADALRRVTVEVQTRRSSLGTGVIWPGVKGVVTNAHVVERRDTCRLEFAGGTVDEGKVERIDRDRDLAFVATAVDGRPAPVLRDLKTLRTGELVYALGTPFGVPGVLAIGIVHRADARWVRADLRLAPGFSGGPLADAQGRIVGINAMIAHGLGLAVPTAAVERFLHATASTPEMGIAIRPVTVDGRRAALVLGVLPGSLAERSGVLMGDVILTLDGRPLTARRDVVAALGAARSAPPRLDILRAGVRQVLGITPSERQDTEAA